MGRLKVASYIEEWLKLECPHCEESNWLQSSFGDILDPDVDAIRCLSCKELFLVCEREEWESEDNLYIEDGVTDPSEIKELDFYNEEIWND